VTGTVVLKGGPRWRVSKQKLDLLQKARTKRQEQKARLSRISKKTKLFTNKTKQDKATL